MPNKLIEDVQKLQNQQIVFEIAALLERFEYGTGQKKDSQSNVTANGTPLRAPPGLASSTPIPIERTAAEKDTLKNWYNICNNETGYNALHHIDAQVNNDEDLVEPEMQSDGYEATINSDNNSQQYYMNEAAAFRNSIKENYAPNQQLLEQWDDQQRENIDKTTEVNMQYGQDHVGLSTARAVAEKELFAEQNNYAAALNNVLDSYDEYAANKQLKPATVNNPFLPNGSADECTVPTKPLYMAQSPAVAKKFMRTATRRRPDEKTEIYATRMRIQNTMLQNLPFAHLASDTKPYWEQNEYATSTNTQYNVRNSYAPAFTDESKAEHELFADPSVITARIEPHHGIMAGNSISPTKALFSNSSFEEQPYWEHFKIWGGTAKMPTEEDMSATGMQAQNTAGAGKRTARTIPIANGELYAEQLAAAAPTYVVYGKEAVNSATAAMAEDSLPHNYSLFSNAGFENKPYWQHYKLPNYTSEIYPTHELPSGVNAAFYAGNSIKANNSAIPTAIYTASKTMPAASAEWSADKLPGFYETAAIPTAIYTQAAQNSTPIHSSNTRFQSRVFPQHDVRTTMPLSQGNPNISGEHYGGAQVSANIQQVTVTTASTVHLTQATDVSGTNAHAQQQPPPSPPPPPPVQNAAAPNLLSDLFELQNGMTHSRAHETPAPYTFDKYVREHLPKKIMSETPLEQLFILFYFALRDRKQMEAAIELHRRNWRYHRRLHVWMTHDEHAQVARIGTLQKCKFTYFVPSIWCSLTQDLTIDLVDLDLLPPILREYEDF